jgi:hypothetical protein
LRPLRRAYVTVFIDLDAKDKPVVFVTPERGKQTVARFEAFLAEHGGRPRRSFRPCGGLVEADRLEPTPAAKPSPTR